MSKRDDSIDPENLNSVSCFEVAPALDDLQKLMLADSRSLCVCVCFFFHVRSVWEYAGRRATSLHKMQ